MHRIGLTAERETSDTEATHPGSEFYETDTGRTYIFARGVWTERISGSVWLVDNLGAVQGVKFINGKPRVSAMPYLYDVAEGNVSDHSLFDKYALNDDVDKLSEEDIWCVGGLYSWPSGATLMDVVSSSAEDDPVKADTNAGSGIHSVRVYYLDTAFAEKTADVTLNGTAAVQIAATDIFRINRIRPLTVGVGLKAAGNIDIKARAPGTAIYSRIATGYTKGRQLVYTVPASKALYLVLFSGSVGGTTVTKYGKFTLRSTYDNVTAERHAWMTAYAERGTIDTFDLRFDGPLKFPAGSDIIVSGYTLDDNCFMTASLRGWLEAA
jgi:hypothetical protein